MKINRDIPDEIAAELVAQGEDLSRRAMESLALEELRAGRITETQLGRILGLGRLAREGFLKAHESCPHVEFSLPDHPPARYKSSDPDHPEMAGFEVTFNGRFCCDPRELRG